MKYNRLTSSKVTKTILIIAVMSDIFLHIRYLWFCGDVIYFFMSMFFSSIMFMCLCGIAEKIHDIINISRLKKSGHAVKATIKDYETEYNRIRTYHPIIEFRTVNKEKIRCRLPEHITFIGKNLKVGNKINIVYDINNPDNCIVIPNSYISVVFDIVIFSVPLIPCLIKEIPVILLLR